MIAAIIPVLAATLLVGLAPPGLAQYQSPLDQLRDGIPISEIACREGKILLEKNHKPYCVSADTAERLEQRGWSIVEQVPVPDGGPSLSITTEKSDFNQSEKIKIRLVNTGTVPLWYPDISHGIKITDLWGVVVYRPPAGEVVVELGPGEYTERIWGHPGPRDPVAEGTYTISAEMRSGQGPAQASTTITISK